MTTIEAVDPSKEVVVVGESVKVVVVAIIIVCSEMPATVNFIITVRLLKAAGKNLKSARMRGFI